MKKKLILTLLITAVILFGQDNLINNGSEVEGSTKYISIDTEIEKLNDLVSKLSKVEISINSSTGNLTVLKDVVATHNKKTQETAAKIAKLNSSRVELEKQIKELESSMDFISIMSQHDVSAVETPELPSVIDIAETRSIEIVEEVAGEEECETCGEEKSNLTEKMVKFNKIRAKMSGNVSKDEYAVLHKQYNSIWKEVNDIKRQIKECELETKNLPIALYNEALEAKQMEDYEEALELLEEAVSLREDFDEAYYQIVSILIELDENSEIDGYLGKISDPEKKGKLYYCRAMNSKDSYPKESISYLKAMSSHYKPELANYYIGLINITKLSNPDVAVKYLKKSLKINPNDPKVLDLIGATYIDMKVAKGQDKNTNIVKGIKYLEQGVTNGSGYKGLDLLFSRLAQAYNNVGKSVSALKYADLAIEQASINSLATANLEKAKALIKMDKSSEAISFLEIAKKDYLTKDEANYWINICHK